MERREKVFTTLKKLEAITIGFIGLTLAGQGSTYFSPQVKYNVPVVLSPVYDYFGPVGLAIGLLILGGGFVIWSYRNWKEHNGSVKQFALVMSGLTILIFGLFHLTSGKTTDKTSNKSYPSLDAPLAFEDINPAKFDNKAVSGYVSEFKGYYTLMETSIAHRDQKAFEQTRNDIGKWFEKTSQLTTRLELSERNKLAYFMIAAGKRLEDWNKRGEQFDK